MSVAYLYHAESDCTFTETRPACIAHALENGAVELDRTRFLKLRKQHIQRLFPGNGLIPVAHDFETYYSAEYSLSKMPAEEYIRDPRFEIILYGIQLGDQESFWVTGTHQEIREQVTAMVPWHRAVSIAHNNSEFDGLILTEKLGIFPRLWVCTLAMARALHGTQVGNSLAKMAKLYRLEEKGTEVVMAMGKRRADFSPEELAAYGGYCLKDNRICYGLYKIFIKKLPATEVQLVHLFTKMFAEPRIKLRHNALEMYLKDILAQKAAHLERAGATQKELRSDAKFAVLLENAGVTPGTKLSPKQKNPDGSPKAVYAFAKTDEFMQDIVEDDEEEPYVRALVEARLGVKSSIVESRLERLLGISGRGLLPVPLKYGATHTHRAGGSGKINLQNLNRTKPVSRKTPSGTILITPHGIAILAQLHPTKKYLKTEQKRIYEWHQCHCIGLRDLLGVPEGKVFVVADSSNIELRTCHLGAGQMDTIEKIRQGVDIYCDFASEFYGRDITKADEKERMHGKVAELQLQYQSGAAAFRRACRIIGGIKITMDEAEETVTFYRQQKRAVRSLWWTFQQALPRMAAGESGDLDPAGLCHFEGARIIKPSGLPIVFEDLHYHQFKDDNGEVEEESWAYIDKEKRRLKRVYGGAMTENFASGLARDVVFEQMLEIEKKYGRKRGEGVVLTVHDEVGAIVSEDKGEECLKFMLDTMHEAPKWWPDLPLKAEGAIAKFYGDAK